MPGSHAYDRQALVYVDGARNVLIAHGLCQNKNDCTTKRILFQRGGAYRIGPFEFGGVAIYVYEVSSPDVVGDLIKTVGEIYKTQRGPRVTLEVYESRHLERKIPFASASIE
jgi:hypothetical protein